MAEMMNILKALAELKTPEDVRAAQGLLNRRLAEIASQAVHDAVQKGFTPGARVEVLAPITLDKKNRFGAIDGPNAQSFTVRLDSGESKRFTPAQLRLVKG